MAQANKNTNLFEEFDPLFSATSNDKANDSNTNQNDTIFDAFGIKSNNVISTEKPQPTASNPFPEFTDIGMSTPVMHSQVLNLSTTTGDALTDSKNALDSSCFPVMVATNAMTDPVSEPAPASNVFGHQP